jgi:hypothetical protein
VQAVFVDGKEIMCDDGLNTQELLYRLCRALDVEFESQSGEWDKNNVFHPNKRR